MRVFTFTGPDGQEYTVETPDGTRPDQAYRMLQNQMQPPEEEGPGVMGQILRAPLEAAKGFASGYVNPISGLASYGYGLAGGEDFEETLVGRGLGAAQEFLAPSDDGAISQVAGGLGQLGSFIGPSVFLKGAGKAATLGAMATGSGSEEARQRVEQARAEGIEVTPEQQIAAQTGGLGIGVLELGSVERLARPLRQIFRGMTKSDAEKYAPGILNSLKRAAGTGSIEAVQEATSSILQDLNQKGIYDPELEVGQSALGEAALGGSVGAIAQGLIDFATRGGRRRQYEYLKAREEREEAERRLEEQRELMRKQAAEQQRALPAPPEKPLLPPPARELTPDEIEDAVYNPTRSFSSAELDDEVKAQVNKFYGDRARKRGVTAPEPLDSPVSVETLIDAGVSQEKIDSMLAQRFGIEQEVDVNAEDIRNLASSRNIIASGDGFFDFLQRTTGARDIEAMTPMQRMAAYKALEKIEPSDTLRALPTGVKSMPFSDTQYQKAAAALKKAAENSKKPISRSTAQKIVRQILADEVQTQRGLNIGKKSRRNIKREDIESVIENAMDDGYIGGVKRDRFDVVNRSKRVIGSYLTKKKAKEFADAQGAYVVQSSRRDIAPVVEEADDGVDIRRGVFEAGSEPEAFDLTVGDERLVSERTQEAAEKKAAQLTEVRQKKIPEINNTIERIEKRIEENNNKIAEAEATGQANTDQFRIQRTRTEGLQRDIETLRDEAAKFAEPVTVTPRGSKPVGKEGFTYFKGEVPQGTFPTEQAAETAAIMSMTDAELSALIRADKDGKGLVKKRRVATAKSELDRRKNGGPAADPEVAARRIREKSRRQAEEGAVKPEVSQEVKALERRLRDRLKKLGLNEVTLKLVDSIKTKGGAEAVGSYSKLLIAISLNARNPMRVLNHESIHALKELGAFTPKQWEVLKRKAKKEWMKKYNIRRRYQAQNLNEEKLLEEAIADAFSDFDTTQKSSGLMGAIFRKLKGFFEGVQNAFNGLGFLTSDSVFRLADDGGLTRRERGRASTAPRMSLKEQEDRAFLNRTPEALRALNQIRAGEITAAEYDAIVNKYRPVRPYGEVPRPATYEEMFNALDAGKRDSIGVPSRTLEDGHPVGLRLDIPAYSRNGVWVPTIHEKGRASGGVGKKIGHESTAVVNNATFALNQKAAMGMAEGRTSKAPIATVEGQWENLSPEEAVRQAEAALRDPDWIQVGMDPYRHSFFYNRETMEPVASATRVIQVGPLVLAKNPEYADRQEFLYSIPEESASLNEADISEADRAEMQKEIDFISTALGLSPDEVASTSLGLQLNKSGEDGFIPNNLDGKSEVLVFLENRRREAGLRNLDLSKEEDRAEIAKLMAAEAMAANRKPAGERRSGLDWYDRVIEVFMRLASIRFPELADAANPVDAEVARSAFKLATAITSQNLNVQENLKLATKVYTDYKNSSADPNKRRFPIVGSGKNGEAMKKNFKLANKMLDEMGSPEMLARFAKTPFIAKELRDAGIEIDGELDATSILGSSIFGPKIGFGFYSNLSGNFNPVTMDMWFMRLLGRLTGNLRAFTPEKLRNNVERLRNAFRLSGKDGFFASDFNKSDVDKAKESESDAIELARKIVEAHKKDYKKNRSKYDSKEKKKSELVLASESLLETLEGAIDFPGGGAERNQIRDVVGKVQTLLEPHFGFRIPAASLQALVWYPEQWLYKNQGAKLSITGEDYAGVMKNLLLKGELGAITDEQRVEIEQATEVLERPTRKSGSGDSQRLDNESVGRRNQRRRQETIRPLSPEERTEFLNRKYKETAIAKQNAKPAGSRVNIEMTPTGAAKQRLDALDAKTRSRIIDVVGTKVVNRLLQGFDADGLVVESFSSRAGTSVPSSSLIFHKKPKGEETIFIAKALGYIFNKESVSLMAFTKAAGYDKKDAVVINLPNTNLEQRESVYKTLNDSMIGNARLADSQVTIGDRMIVVNNTGLSSGAFAGKVNEALANDYQVVPTEVFVKEIESGEYNYARPEKKFSPAERAVRKRAIELRKQQRELFGSEISKQSDDVQFSLATDEDVVRPRKTGKNLNFQPVQEDAIKVNAVNYSEESPKPPTWGTASVYFAPSEEYFEERLKRSDDPRIKERVYFYTPKSDGSMPEPPPGSGPFVYQRNFTNILGPGEKLDRLLEEAGEDMNAFESSVLDAGYDGYLVADEGVVVVMGGGFDALKIKNRPVIQVTRENAKKLKPLGTETKAFKDWFYRPEGTSVVTTEGDGKGEPEVMYHATLKDFTKFKPDSLGMIFVSPDPAWASYYVYGQDRDRKFNPRTGELIHIDAPKALTRKFPEGGQVIPVYVYAANPFDFRKKEHLEILREELQESGAGEQIDRKLGVRHIDLLGRAIRIGMWQAIERPGIISAIKDAGFDGAFVREVNYENETAESPINLAVFDEKQIKSAYGNVGTFSRNETDIQYSLALDEEPSGRTVVSNKQAPRKSIVTPERDAAYMNALVRGEPETAKEILDETIKDQIVSVLSPDLLKKEYREANKTNTTCGHCYAATEALYHMLGGVMSDFQPMRARDKNGVVHWWLQSTDGKILDPTADQYYSVGETPPYSTGKSGGFLTKEPSKRAREVMKRLSDKGVKIKSAEITTDAEGKFIPLSERFEADKEDRRYSLGDISTGGNIGRMPDKLGGKPIRVSVGSYDELNEVGSGAKGILGKIFSAPVTTELTSEQILERALEKIENVARTYNTVYQIGDKLVIDNGSNGVLLKEGKDAMEVETFYTNRPPFLEERPAWTGETPTDFPPGSKDPITPREVGNKATTEEPMFSLSETLSDKTNAAINRVTTARKKEGFFERIMEAISPRARQAFRQAFINRYESIERLSLATSEEKRRRALAEGATEEQAAEIARESLMADVSSISSAIISDRASGMTAAAFQYGIPVFRDGGTTISNENGTVKGMLDVFKPLAEYNDPYIYQAFQLYAAARRGIRLEMTDNPGRMSPEEIQEGLALGNKFKEFDYVFNEYQKFNAGLVKYMRDTGVISAENADRWMSTWDYIPYYRQLDGERTGGPNIFSPISGVKAPKKLRKPGEPFVEKPLDDFLETVVRNANAAIESGMKNEAARRTVRDIEYMGMGERVGITEQGADIVEFKEDGKTVRVRVDDPLLAESMRGLNMPSLPFISLLAKPAEFLRNLVTKDPGFMLANLMRDSLQAWVTSGKDMTPLVDTFKQYGKALADKSPEVEAFRMAGLFTGYDFAGDVQSSTESFTRMLRERTGTLTPTEKSLWPITKVWDSLEKASVASDMATRAEVYKRTLEETGNEQEALFQALELMNFSRKGNSALIRILTAVVPFMNARIQGLDVLYRSGFGKSAMSNRERQQKAFIARSMYMMALSTMYWMLASDTEEYETAEQEVRDNYWIIGNVRIPIPFEIGTMFKVFPERILEYSFGTDTGRDLKQAAIRNITSTLAMNPIPQAFVPIVENVANYSFFTGNPVIGRGVEYLAPEFQKIPSTSLTAIKIGEATGLSPMQIDNLIRGYTGTIGSYMSMAIDSIIRTQDDPTKAALRLDQYPVLKRFWASDEGSGTVSTFYDLKRQVDTATRTINMLERTGDLEALKEYTEKTGGKLLAIKPYINSLNKNISQLRRAERQIQESQMPSEEKKERLEQIRRARIAITRNIQEIKKKYL